MTPSPSSSSPIRFGTAGIRGRSEEFITAELAASVACALAREFAARDLTRQCVVARDTREHAAKYAGAARDAFARHGFDVHDVGVACSGVVCHYLIGTEGSGGIYVTGSHLPEGQIGLIALDHEATYFGGDDARAVEARFGEECRLCDGGAASPPFKGVIEEVDARSHYEKRVGEMIGEDLRGVSLALDPAGGSAASFASKVIAGFGVRVTAIHDTPTQHFPREPEPRSRTLGRLRQTVLDSGARFGAGYDIDADRVYFLDEKGEGVPEDVAGAIFAERSLTAGSICVAPVNSSTLIEEVCERLHARFEYCRIGQPEIVRAMKRTGATFAYEESGKYYVKGIHFADSIAATLVMASIILNEGPLSKIVEALPKLYKWSAAVECPEAKKEGAMRLAVAEAPHAFLAKPYRYVDIDGFKVIFRDGSWVMIRASGTEALLRVYAEAREEPRARAFGEKARELLERSVANAAAG